MIERNQTVQPVLSSAQRVALVVAAIGVVLAIVSIVINPTQFWQSYLVAFLYCFGFSVACLTYIIVHYLGGGRWGAAIGDLLRTGASLFWLLAIMFIPIVIGVPFIYAWTDPAVLSGLPASQQFWYSFPVWLVRSIIYFVIWILLAYFLNRWFQEWDRTGDPIARRRLRNLAGGGIVLMFLTVSFAMFDWVMSLDVGWFSTVYGLMIYAGHGLAGWALMIFILTRLRHRWPVSEYNNWRLWQDLGTLLLANTILWAYLSFSQFLLIWSGNLAEEIPWYLRRTTGGWEYLGIVVIFAQFAIPFALLVLRQVRRNPALLGGVALLQASSRFLENIILVEPAFPSVPLLSHWPVLVVGIGLVGIWLAVFFWQLQGRLVAVRPAALFPEHEPVHPLPGGHESAVRAE